MDSHPTPPSLPTSRSQKPSYRRWWFFGAIALLAIGIIGADLDGDDSGEDDELAGASTTTTSHDSVDPDPISTTTAATTATTTAPSTTTTTPTTTTNLPQGWEPVTGSGSGDDFIEFSTPNDDPAVLHLTHDGSSNFIVSTYSSQNEQLNLLVNVIGDYSGSVPLNFILGEEIAFLEIQAVGAWTFTATYLYDIPVSPGGFASGEGDSVVVVEVASPELALTHAGESNFIVVSWTTAARELLVNEIGQYSGTVRTDTGTIVYEIQADGSWTLEPG